MYRAVIALALAASAVAGASPARDLDLGTNAFRAKDYEKTIQYITPLLYPDEKLAQPEELVTAHVLLGAAAFERNDRNTAKDEFEKALLLEPDKTLDTLLFSNGAVRLFDETKEDIAARRQRDEELRKLEEERERLRQIALNTYEARPLWVNFIPLGAGQLQERRFRAFGAFLSSELVTGGASVAIYLYLQSKYPTGVPAQEVRTYNTLYVTGLVSSIACYSLVIGGIIDAYVHYTPRVQINVSPELKKQLEKKPKKTSLRDRIHVAPMLTPTSVGLGIGWEN